MTKNLLIPLVLFSLSFGMSFYFIKSDHKSIDSEQSSDEKDDNRAKNKGTGATINNVQQLEAAFKKVQEEEKILPKQAKVNEIFSSGNQADKAILESFTMLQQHIELSPDMQEKLVKQIIENPEEGIASIDKGLDQLPMEGFAIERASLLTVANRIEGKEKEVFSLAWTEATTNNVPKVDGTILKQVSFSKEEVEKINNNIEKPLPVIIAFTILIQNSDDVKHALEISKQVVATQGSTALVETFKDIFLKKYPKGKFPGLAK